MGFRILSTAIVLFWLVMTGLLVQLVYFPEESRMSRVDPDFVMGLFMQNPEPSDIYGFKGTEYVGKVSMGSRGIPATETDGVPTRKRMLFINADGDVDLPNLERQTLFWIFKVYMEEDRSIEKVHVSVRFEKPDVRVTLDIDPKELGFNYMVWRDKELVTDSKKDPNAPGLAQLRMLMFAWGLNPDELEKAAEERKKQVDISARHGQIKLEGVRLHAYVLTFSLGGGQDLKFYFSDAGELVKVDTFLGYQFLSEAYAPRELREKLKR